MNAFSVEKQRNFEWEKKASHAVSFMIQLKLQ